MSNTNEPLFRDFINELNEVLAKHQVELVEFEEGYCEDCGTRMEVSYLDIAKNNHYSSLTIQNGKFKYA